MVWASPSKVPRLSFPWGFGLGWKENQVSCADWLSVALSCHSTFHYQNRNNLFTCIAPSLYFFFLLHKRWAERILQVDVQKQERQYLFYPLSWFSLLQKSSSSVISSQKWCPTHYVKGQISELEHHHFKELLYSSVVLVTGCGARGWEFDSLLGLLERG